MNANYRDRFAGSYGCRTLTAARLSTWSGSLCLLVLWTIGADAQVLNTIHNFSGADGSDPLGSMVLSGSTMYGVTHLGGNNSLGSIYSIATNGAFHSLYSFSSNSGDEPVGAQLALSGSTIYGNTWNDGPFGAYGSVYAVGTSGSNYNILHSFSTLSDPGERPLGGTVLAGSTLFVAGNSGTVVSINTNGTGYNTVHSQSTESGDTLSLVGSNLYQLVYSVTEGATTAVSMGTNGSNYHVVHTFSTSDGYYPVCAMALSGTTFYGLMSTGGAFNDGTIFSMGIDGSGYRLLFSFSGANGSQPFSGLTLVGNKLYGTANAGGANGDGTVFSINSDGTNFRSVLSFNGSNGTSPRGILTANGTMLYGVTDSGGTDGAGTVFSLNVAPAVINLSSIPGATIISGGSATFAGVISNSPTAAFNLNYSTSAAVQSGSATFGTIAAGTGSLAPAASQSYSFSATSTTLGNNTISLTASDPSAAITSQSVNTTLTVLGHAAPSLAVASGNNQSVIVGAINVTAGLSLTNGSTGQSGLAALDVNSLGAGVSGGTGGKLAASGSSQAYAATLGTGVLGTRNEVFAINVGDDHTLAGALAPTNVSSTATVTVYDHANASLSSSASQTAETISFGNFLKGAQAPPGQSFTICNRAVNTTALFTSNLKLTGFASSGDAALTTTLSPFGGLAPGGFITYTASLNTANYSTTGVSIVTMSGAELADDSLLPGAGNNNSGALTITLLGTVGNATADASNSPASFGPGLTSQVASSGSYANLESTVKSTTGSGGDGALGTTATILAGTNSGGSGQIVSMAWRTRTTGADTSFASDVLNLSGMALGDTGQTAPFVLQMSYDAGRFGNASAEGLAADDEMIALEWLDPNDGMWENAINGNFGTNQGGFQLGAWRPGDMTLGDWGVNTANHTVWAVLNHNSEFAVVPEPSTIALLVAGVICMEVLRSRRSAVPRGRAVDVSLAEHAV